MFLKVGDKVQIRSGNLLGEQFLDRALVVSCFNHQNREFVTVEFLSGRRAGEFYTRSQATAAGGWKKEA